MRKAVIFALSFMAALNFLAACSRQTEQKMNKAQELLAEADSIFKTGQYDQSRDIYQAALTEAENTDSKSDQVEALAMIARTYLTTNKIDAGREWLEKAGALASDEAPRGWSRYIGVRGRLLWQEQKNAEATEQFKKMYEYCLQHDLSDRAIDAAHMVAITGSEEEQVEWGLKGIKEAEAKGITTWLGPLWNNLGWTYEHTGDYAKCLDAYQNARIYHYKHGTERNKIIADYAVGHAYVLTGDFENGEKWLRPLVPVFEEQKDDEFLGLTCYELGQIEYARHDITTAHSYLTRAEKLLKEQNMDQWDPDTFKKITQLAAETSGQ